MQITRTIEARDIVGGMRITDVEDVSIRQGEEGILVEGADLTTDPITGFDQVDASVWNSSWMFGIVLQPTDRVTVTWDPAEYPVDPPEAPSRVGLVNSHGKWVRP